MERRLGRHGIWGGGKTFEVEVSACSVLYTYSIDINYDISIDEGRPEFPSVLRS